MTKIINSGVRKYRINYFESIKKPTVLGYLSIDEIFEKIKFGDNKLPLINCAREYGKGHEKYHLIKEKCLPTFRFNFLYQNYGKDNYIIESTGLIYIDVDDINEIPVNRFVFAKWKSLSNKGFGILVKVKNLTKENFALSYESISNTLGIKSDPNAKKANQQNVLSYDPNIYINYNSEVYVLDNFDKVSFNSVKKEKKGILPNDTSKANLRFDNSDEYFVNDTKNAFKYFDDKILISKPFIPWKGIKNGDRNNKVFMILSQYAMLNPSQDKSFLVDIARNINKKVFPPLSIRELNSIVSSVIKKRLEGSLELFKNISRRIIFNPNINLSGKDKKVLSAKKIGEVRREKAIEQIELIINEWNFELHGKINQKKIHEKGKMSLSKVKKYWSNFKDYVFELNEKNNEIINKRIIND